MAETKTDTKKAKYSHNIAKRKNYENISYLIRQAH